MAIASVFLRLAVVSMLVAGMVVEAVAYTTDLDRRQLVVQEDTCIQG